MSSAVLEPVEEYQTAEFRIREAPDGASFQIDLELLGWRTFTGIRASVDIDHLQSLDSDSTAYGQALGHMIFGDEALGPAYRETMAATRAQNKGLRIRLVIEAPELQALHWERIYHPMDGGWRPLASTGGTPFSRYAPVQQWDRPGAIDVRPVQMLVVVASPEGLDSWGLDPIGLDEQQALRELLDSLVEVDATYLKSGGERPPTLNELRRALSEGVHLVHFLCHGAATDGGTVLYLEGENGGVEAVRADRIVDAFKTLVAPPVFCFLAACESAARTRHDAFAPLGPTIVEDGGVHAAVAMTEKVGLRTAQEFTGQFYTRLLSHGLVDLAANQARALVQDEWDWGAPVLFSRLPDNVLLAPGHPDTLPVIETQRFEPETVLVPAGPFQMGAYLDENGIDEHETPQHEVSQPAYRLGRFPVTNEQYAEFLRRVKDQDPPKRAGWFLREPPQDKLQHPITGVSWHDASAYCEWLSQETDRRYRLPTEAEWEKAAHGKDGRRYPWGDEWVDERANAGSEDTMDVSAFADGASIYDCLDMLGNVQEWTNTVWGSDLRRTEFPYPYQPDDGHEDPDPNLHRVYRLHRGGSYRNSPDELHCAMRGRSDANSTSQWRGFRVALDLGKRQTA